MQFSIKKKIMIKKICASAGNRTRAARVAGEHSTTEPPMLVIFASYESCQSLRPTSKWAFGGGGVGEGVEGGGWGEGRKTVWICVWKAHFSRLGVWVAGVHVQLFFKQKYMKNSFSWNETITKKKKSQKSIKAIVS